MRQRSQEKAEREGEAQLRRAGLFWAAFDRAVSRIRYAFVLEAHYKCLLRKESRSLSPRGRLLTTLQNCIDATHDLRLCEERNMAAMEETAKGAEMMSRIWYEESDGRIHNKGQQ